MSKLTKSPSLAALRMSLRVTGGDVDFGCTSFLWRNSERLYLITNWHCVTGWHPTRNTPLCNMGFWPEIALLHLVMRSEAGEYFVQQLTLRLHDYERAFWLEHPTLGRKVDVVALELPPLAGSLGSVPVNDVPQQSLKFMVADDAFVIGFPDVHHDIIPIWKRASLATEPYVDDEDLPKVLVDTATRPGMSGGPVFVLQRGMHRLADPEYLVTGHGQRFLGAYSSRIGDELQGFQLGEVWKERVIDEIINGGIAGQDPHLANSTETATPPRSEKRSSLPA